MSLFYLSLCICHGKCCCYIMLIVFGSGAVAQDGRIEPGDMILEVNNISFENMTNDEAVQTLRSAAQQPGYVTVAIIAVFNRKIKYIFGKDV